MECVTIKGQSTEKDLIFRIKFQLRPQRVKVCFCSTKTFKFFDKIYYKQIFCLNFVVNKIVLPDEFLEVRLWTPNLKLYSRRLHYIELQILFQSFILTTQTRLMSCKMQRKWKWDWFDLKEKELLAPDFHFKRKRISKSVYKGKFFLVFMIKLKSLFKAFDEIKFAYLFKSNPRKPSSLCSTDCHLKNVESVLAFDFLNFVKFWWT